jgi:hypothetical protein
MWKSPKLLKVISPILRSLINEKVTHNRTFLQETTLAMADIVV